MKNLIAIVSLLLISVFSFGQTNPVKFDISQEGETLVFNAEIDNGWHLYAVNLPNPNEGPLPTEIVFNDLTLDKNVDGIPDNHVEINGKITESQGITEMDDAFGVEVIYFKDNATFNVPFKKMVNAPNPVAQGMIHYMVCNDESCIPFDVPFEVRLK